MTGVKGDLNEGVRKDGIIYSLKEEIQRNPFSDTQEEKESLTCWLSTRLGCLR